MELVKGKCEQCEAHDRETARLVNALFHQDEATMLTMLLVAQMTQYQQKLMRTRANDPQRLVLVRDRDFASQMVGKLFVSFNRDYRRTMQKKLKDLGIHVEIEHQACPHSGGTTPTDPPEGAA